LDSLRGDLESLPLDLDFLPLDLGFVPLDLEIRPRCKCRRSPSPGDERRGAYTGKLPIAEQAMNDYALFAICLGKIAILDSSAASWRIAAGRPETEDADKKAKRATAFHP